MRLNDITALPPILPWSSKSDDRSRKRKPDDEPPKAEAETHVDMVEERRAGLAEHHTVDIRI